MPLDVLDIVQSGGERVVDVDDDDLPVSLTLVQEGHDSEDLDLPTMRRGRRDRVERQPWGVLSHTAIWGMSSH